MDPLLRGLRSGVLCRSRLTLSSPVDYFLPLILLNPVGWDSALLLLPITGSHLFLKEKEALHASYSILCPFCSAFVGDSMV